jgi:hypothetical protein
LGGCGQRHNQNEEYADAEASLHDHLIYDSAYRVQNLKGVDMETICQGLHGANSKPKSDLLQLSESINWTILCGHISKAAPRNFTIKRKGCEKQP